MRSLVSQGTPWPLAAGFCRRPFSFLHVRRTLFQEVSGGGRWCVGFASCAIIVTVGSRFSARLYTRPCSSAARAPRIAASPCDRTIETGSISSPSFPRPWGNPRFSAALRPCHVVRPFFVGPGVGSLGQVSLQRRRDISCDFLWNSFFFFFFFSWSFTYRRVIRNYCRRCSSFGVRG